MENTIITEQELTKLIDSDYAGLPAIKDPVMKKTVNLSLLYT